MTRTSFVRPLILGLMLGLAWPVLASDRQIRQAIQTLAPGAKITQINNTGLKGIREVVIEGEQGPMVVYTDNAGRFILVGDMLDVQTRRNLTKERMDKLTEVKWDSLPLHNAIKVVRGNGQRKLAVFSDPDCGFCKRAEVEFAKLDNVTIYVFLFPLAMHPDAPRKSRLVWCSKDRDQAWLDLMLRGRLPEGRSNCDNPVDENLALGARLRVDGTPAMFLPNGRRVPGFMPAARLEPLLDASQRP